MTEQWRFVPGWERLYEVSNWGRVRSVARLGVNGKQANRPYGGGFLKLIKKRGTGYLCVSLHNKGTKEQRHVHELVLSAFIGPRPDGMQCCHNNGIRDDNRLENLRWDTAAANNADMKKHGTAPIGERNYRAKLTEEQVRYIRQSPENQPTLARKFGVTQVLISRIRLRKAWAHV